LLDVNLPETNGFEVLENIRGFSNVPVIVLNVRDDYLLKPFSPADLLARVQAVLRRSAGA
jgi:DNA-binding response OmpR family regulator